LNRCVNAAEDLLIKFVWTDVKKRTRTIITGEPNELVAQGVRRFTAIVAANDHMALGAIRALHAKVVFGVASRHTITVGS
jgi:DNA-binding LacI/PurR family transcriptional regulator